MRSKITPGLIFFFVPYVLVIGAYYGVRHLGQGISFIEHRDVLGGTMSTYSGTMIAILIAALTFMLGIGGRNARKLKAYGYMSSVAILYALTFVELGMIFLTGIFLMATSKIPIPLLPSISIGMAAASLVHISIVMIQIFGFSKNQ
ncbi:biopolymer transporter ExbB [uncultured Pantoea sp.]|uniref:biopolymer transporter ExbB n=1 Tax=uncultured Pantoea sp. TaxID=218084 RepID=UPI0025CBF1D7|nr:biopolymer transporter ExbB [uncultured Pantoea sp.]MDY0926483.1 biopolymer transporter ExbB [Enterobacter sp. CFBP8995]